MAAVVFGVFSGWAAEGTIHREAIEWTDVWMPNMNKNDLPRVLLIGDSITRGYYAGVEQNLKGKAYVAHITTSKAVGDPALLSELAAFLAEAKFDVVHFNNGLHGWAYSDEEYRQGLPELLATIRKGAPGAKLIWAATTPTRRNREPGPDHGRIQVRNAAAHEYFTAQGVATDDLYTLMVDHFDLHTDGVHFNAAGCAILAEQVAREIEKRLPAAP